MNLDEYKDSLNEILSRQTLEHGYSAEIEDILKQENLKRLLLEIVEDPVRLETVARHSYRHSLGFTKVVIFDSSTLPNGEELRLHIWWPDLNTNTRPYIEEGDKHEHNWNFASRVIHGKFRNFLFQPKPASEEEVEIVNEFEAALSNLPSEKTKIDLIKLLYKLEVELFILDNDADSVIEEIANITGLATEKIIKILDLYWKFRNKKTPGSEYEEYSRDGVYKLERQPEWTIGEGQIYYHSQEFGHYLYNDPSTLTSTFLVTGKSTQSSGAFYHSTFTVEELDSEDSPRQGFTIQTLQEELRKYLELL